MKTENKILAPALWATTLGPIATFLGYTYGAYAWPGYDGMVKTISDLAANDSPVQLMMSSVFLFGALCDFVVAIYARALPKAARVAIFLAGIATIGLTVFATPSQDSYSIPHRIFAIASFIIFSIWPLFAIRRGPDAPPLLRPTAAILGTVFLVSVSIWFLSLWADEASTITGLGERIGVAVQGMYPMVVIWHSWYWLRNKVQ